VAPQSSHSTFFEETLMKRILVAALAVTLMTSSVMAKARDDDNRSRHSRHDERGSKSSWSKAKGDSHASRHHERRERYADDRYRYDGHRDRHWDRGDYRQAHATAHRHARFHAGQYHRPSGYRHHAWHRGAHLPSSYYAPRYVVHDYHAYHLHRPPYGHHWVRVDNDVLLTAITTGVVVAVVNDLFY
jgi:Ni/Co efflux regulator RcnB